MNKILALMSVLGLAFLVGCGDDDSSSSSSSGTYSCDMQVNLAGMTTHSCFEMAKSSVNEQVEASCVSVADFGITATVGSACPSGSIISCENTVEGITGTAYYYDDEYKGMTCEEIIAQENEEEAE